MRRMVQDGGRLGQVFFCGGSNEGFKQLHTELKKVKSDAEQRENEHCKRTTLPVQFVRDLLLRQLAANDHNMLFSFYTDPETRKVLTLEWSLVDVEFNVQTLLRMPQEITDWMDRSKRVILTVDSPAQAPCQRGDACGMDVNFYLNNGCDAEILGAYKAFIAAEIGIAEASRIEDMIKIFNKLPVWGVTEDNARLKLQRDPQTNLCNFFVARAGEQDFVAL